MRIKTRLRRALAFSGMLGCVGLFLWLIAFVVSGGFSFITFILGAIAIIVAIVTACCPDDIAAWLDSYLESGDGA